MSCAIKSKLKTGFLAVAMLATGICFGVSPRYQSDELKIITGQELTTMADSLPPMVRRQLAENEKQRWEIIKRVKEIFALAQAAQAAGLDKTEKFKQQLEIQLSQVLAESEARKSAESENKKPSEVSDAEITAYGTAHAKEYDALIKVMTEGAKEQPSKEQHEGMKKSWAEIKIRVERARKAGLEKDPSVQLQLKLQQAQILAGAYQESLKEKLKPTLEELREYYQTNPDANPETIKQQAADVLRRIQAGASFIAMAKQYSADGSAVKGGLLRWFGKGRMVPEFEAAAFSLQKGQVSDLVKSKFGYHIIKVESRQFRMPLKAIDDVSDNAKQELILARHILFSTNQAEDAERKIAEKKVQRAVEDVTLQYSVIAPTDFIVNAPPAAAQTQPDVPSSVAELQRAKTKPKPQRKPVKKH